MTSSKAARWLDLIAFLLSHHSPVSRDRIFGQVRGYDGDPESARRKFERDKADLREMGVEIETVALSWEAAGTEDQQGYRLRPGSFYLPYLELAQDRTTEHPYRHLPAFKVSESELTILDRATRRLADLHDFPLAQAAASVRQKLAFDLPLAPAQVERTIGHPMAVEGRAALAVLQEATAARQAVACHYYTIGRDAEQERVLEPWGLFFQWSRWYCVARPVEHESVRVFRVDRMRDARVLTEQTFRPPGDLDIRDWLGRAPWDLAEGPRTRVLVRFSFPDSRSVVRDGVGEVVDLGDGDGSAVVAFNVGDQGPFLRWLLPFRSAATVLEPSGVGAALDGLRQEVAQLYSAERSA